MASRCGLPAPQHGRHCSKPCLRRARLLARCAAITALIAWAAFLCSTLLAAQASATSAGKASAFSAWASRRRDVWALPLAASLALHTGPAEAKVVERPQYSAQENGGLRGQSNKDVQKYTDMGDGLKVSDISVPKDESAIVKQGDSVTVDMVGRLAGWNGQVFLKTTDKGGFSEAPVSFKVGAGEVIPGLERGVVGMMKGGVRRLVIPPLLGYPRPTTFDLLGKPGYLPDPGLSSESAGQPWELRNRLVNGVLMNSEREDTLVIDVKVKRIG